MKVTGRFLDLTEKLDGTRKRKMLTHDDITLRRTKRQVFSDNDSPSDKPSLPPLTLKVVEVPFATTYEREFYERVSKATVLDLRNMDEVIDANDRDLREQYVFELIIRLRQCSVNPALVVRGYQRKFGQLFPVNLIGSFLNPNIMLREIGIPSKTRVLCT